MPEDSKRLPDFSTFLSETSSTSSMEDSSAPPLPDVSAFLVSEYRPPTDIDLLPPVESAQLSAPQKHRETLRHRARQILNDPIGWRKLKTKFQEGRLSPQEFSKLAEIGFHFDVDEKAAPPTFNLQINQVFADGTSVVTDAAVVAERK
jgi:hypothetical protein